MNGPDPAQKVQRALLAWFEAHARELPWRMVQAGGQRDPYRVWVSEVLLQQTQISRGKGYFENFVQQFPDVQALSAAPIEAVLKAWEGCGYYARARNLHRAAKVLAASGLPQTYEGWLALPGVGPYTAAAVSSLAYGEARAVNDGNVRRVLSRLWAERQPSDTWVQRRADELLERSRPGDWNEALMDLGATLCSPKSPRCSACPLSDHCGAYASGDPGAYPAPKPRTPVQAIRAVALLIGDAHSAYLEQRRGSLLGGLYGLPTEEGGPEDALPRLLERLGAAAPRYLGAVGHSMTHRRITLEVYAAEDVQAPLERRAVASLPLSRLDHKALALLEEPGAQARLWSAPPPRPRPEGVD